MIVRLTHAYGPLGGTNCATKPETAAGTLQRADGEAEMGDVRVTVTANATFASIP